MLSTGIVEKDFFLRVGADSSDTDKLAVGPTLFLLKVTKV